MLEIADNRKLSLILPLALTYSHHSRPSVSRLVFSLPPSLLPYPFPFLSLAPFFPSVSRLVFSLPPSLLPYPFPFLSLAPFFPSVSLSLSKQRLFPFRNGLSHTYLFRLVTRPALVHRISIMRPGVHTTISHPRFKSPICRTQVKLEALNKYTGTRRVYVQLQSLKHHSNASLLFTYVNLLLIYTHLMCNTGTTKDRHSGHSHPLTESLGFSVNLVNQFASWSHNKAYKNGNNSVITLSVRPSKQSLVSFQPSSLLEYAHVCK